MKTLEMMVAISPLLLSFMSCFSFMFGPPEDLVIRFTIGMGLGLLLSYAWKDAVRSLKLIKRNRETEE